MHFTTLQNEGSLIPADLLAEIYTGHAAGQNSNDFGLTPKSRLTDEMAARWSAARASWQSFQNKIHRIDKEDGATTLTREHWVSPLLRQLGFDGLQYCRTAATVGGRNYPISHRLGEKESGLPIHIEGANTELGKRPANARLHVSPHALLQEYLNRTDHLWGMVTNGYQLRILRDAARMSRPTFLEFNLRQMMEAEQFAEFQLLFRIVHRTRWPQALESAHDCWLEKYFLNGIESGSRVRDRLRDGVEEALKIFGTGFLSHPGNAALRQRIADKQLEATQLYRQLLRLIYRFLFLLVAEERRMIGVVEGTDLQRFVYDRYYSISGLREKVERPIYQHDHHYDLWERVKQTFRLYSVEDKGKMLNVPALNGALFGPETLPDLENATLFNRDFLHGFAHLSLFKDDKITRRINYAHLDVEELGSVYESLLEFHPNIREEHGHSVFDLVAGSERKSTGSYYTRPELVQELIKSALVPVIETRLQEAKKQSSKDKSPTKPIAHSSPGRDKHNDLKTAQEAALLSIKVCDPACGSGHFLLAAARRIGKELARVRTGEEEPSPEEFRLAVRQVLQHCIYGVDLNPLAVDLCKVALWVEGHNPGKPLTFLDHRIKCGNSLVGVMDLKVLHQGISDEAFKPVTGDDKEVAAAMRQRNKRERQEWLSGQKRLNFDEPLLADHQAFAEAWRELARIDERNTDDVKIKAQRYEKLQQKGEKWYRDWTACNLWTYAFFSPLKETNRSAILTSEYLLRFLENSKSVAPILIEAANTAALHANVFHWPLEFPEVMQAGGFDVVLGNPPWERIKLQEQEFFASRDPAIATAANKAARDRLIEALIKKNPQLHQQFTSAKYMAEASSRFVRSGGRFPLTAVGDVNTYALFAELFKHLLNQRGRCGVIVPTGIATDDTCKHFFGHLNEQKALVSLYDFENREALFPGVHRSFKFSLLTLSNKPVGHAQFSFFLTRTTHLDDEVRRFTLSPEDIELINPNTHTAPVFRTQVDAELTKKIYERVPALVNEKTGENPWGVSFMTMFHMSNDSHLFHNKQSKERMPLYEAKMIWQYDHRFGSYDGVDPDSNSTQLPMPTPAQYADQNYEVTPRYWVDREEVESRLEKRNREGTELSWKWERDWLLGFRDITNATNERTAIFSLLPRVAVGNKIPLLVFEERHENRIACFLGNVNSIVFDYVARQKMGGTTLNFFIVKQFPVFAPAQYEKDTIEFITKRVVELVYHSEAMTSFAVDMDFRGKPFKWNNDRRASLRAELDAYYAKLYGLTRDELRYILDPQEVYGPDFAGETFRVLKEKEIKKYGEYRTRRLVLEAWDRMFKKPASKCR